jgi:PPK2 family polyphosphate:nucleotide phosphotransferase
MEKAGEIDISRYLVKPDENVKLSEYATKCDIDINKDLVRDMYFPEIMEDLALLQAKLYAQNSYGLIVIFQAMDAAGKDSTVRRVFSNLIPSGINVVSFKKPNTEETDHDYMWRINRELPRRGEIGIFNRSHYEDVVTVRVHDLLKQDKLPKKLVDKDVWDTRFRQIRNWERYLFENGFPVIKIFLHVSKEEQLKRIADRILNKKKNWKFDISDITERRYWDTYQKLYGEAIEKTSTEYAPWYIVPADNKWYTRFVVARIVERAMHKLAPEFPEMSEETKEQIEKIRQMVESGHVGMLDEM